MLKKQACYPAKITGYTSDGRGVAHIDGCAVFIPNAIAGETCSVRIVHVGKNQAEGRIARLETRSSHRINRACPYAKQCGGCSFHHMDYDEECRLKTQRVTDALRRIGGFDPGDLQLLPAPAITHYRNKAQFPVCQENGAPQAGFYRAGTHTVIPVQHCLIQAEAADLVRSAVVAHMRQYHIPAYDEVAHSGLVRHIYVRCGEATGQVLACIVINGRRMPHDRQLLDSLLSQVPGLRSVVLGVNTKPGNVVLGDEFIPLYGDGVIEDILCGLRFRISPKSFYQVNRTQAERLYERAIALAGLGPTDTVLDLYCGAGTITLAMAGKARQAIGVEVVADAVADARENARRNGVQNARFFCADAGQAAAKLAQEGTRPQVIVVDPPRKGLSPDVIAAAAQMQPDRIVYVSCDPATLARDIARFRAVGYDAVHAEAVDLFPRCKHVETVVLLSQRKPNDIIEKMLM